MENNTKVRVVNRGDLLDGQIGNIIGKDKEIPHLGQMYIVVFDKPISDTYPYSAYIISEKQLQRV